jgi:hypothetical protein
VSLLTHFMDAEPILELAYKAPLSMVISTEGVGLPSLNLYNPLYSIRVESWANKEPQIIHKSSSSEVIFMAIKY